MPRFATLDDVRAIEGDIRWEDRDVPRTLYTLLSNTAQRFPDNNAMTFQLLSGPGASAETLTWREFHRRVTQTANLFRSLGVGESDVVAYVLPNANETLFAFIGGAVAGIVNPINPLLEPEQISAILRETGAKIVVTLKAFPKTDVPQKVAEALKDAPNVETVLEVDLKRYLSPPKSWIVPLLRPKNPAVHGKRVLNFNSELEKQPSTLAFEDRGDDRVAAYFHTGGTTGMPKVAQHRYSGMIYNGWIGQTLLFTEKDNIICPLPLFHVFACHVIVMAALAAGSHVVFPTPQGYRGDGVFDNFWKLIARWKISFVIIVPTAISALMQRTVNADISSVQTAFSGSSPLPVELFRRFEKATGVNIIEGYGLTEATCLVSCNPIDGKKKIGSVGVPFPHTDVKILLHTAEGPAEMGVDEIGEICVANPGVIPGGTYTEADKNRKLFHFDTYLRTGDLGRIDSDGYLWITGRAKDLIIRGGHNIDPALIEEALAGHEAVAMVGAIGQPDAHAGELPCAFVELIAGAEVTVEELMKYAQEHVQERAAWPKHIEILSELPKTAVGKVFKPDLRKRAITRVLGGALSQSGLGAEVASVTEDKKLGLVAHLKRSESDDPDKVREVLGGFAVSWDWAD